MKLLLDQNLSRKLPHRIDDLFPGSTQVFTIGLDHAADRAVWDYARDNDFTIVTQDGDFADLSSLFGMPPKVIWLRCGNQKTSKIEALLRSNYAKLLEFQGDPEAGILEIF